MRLFVGLILGFVVGWIGHAKRDSLKTWLVAWVTTKWGK